MNLEIVDYAELAVPILRKISDTQPVEVLKSGALSASMEVFHFLTNEVHQEVCSLAMNICSKLTLESFDELQNVLDRMKELVTIDNRKKKKKKKKKKITE
eukprot:TRINITY_DN13294_c0_g1_i3.p1 TRINITY_DN13294_c0_g1~~TRINITY_DN13294_c0_g1_i3.p1  ORF type:complete len:100 (-),score=27.59 TRINITY_DN13294_c0_g1_i3:19-318(-)